MKTFAKTPTDGRENGGDSLKAETYVKLFGFIPFLKIEIRKSRKTFFLFYVLPVFRCRNKEAE